MTVDEIRQRSGTADQIEASWQTPRDRIHLQFFHKGESDPARQLLLTKYPRSLAIAIGQALYVGGSEPYEFKGENFGGRALVHHTSDDFTTIAFEFWEPTIGFLIHFDERMKLAALLEMFERLPNSDLPTD